MTNRKKNLKITHLRILLIFLCIFLYFLTYVHKNIYTVWMRSPHPHHSAWASIHSPDTRKLRALSSHLPRECQRPHLSHPHSRKGKPTSEDSKQVPGQGFHRRGVTALAGQVPQRQHGFVHQARAVGLQLTWTQTAAAQSSVARL